MSQETECISGLYINLFFNPQEIQLSPFPPGPWLAVLLSLSYDTWPLCSCLAVPSLSQIAWGSEWTKSVYKTMKDSTMTKRNSGKLVSYQRLRDWGSTVSASPGFLVGRFVRLHVQNCGWRREGRCVITMGASGDAAWAREAVKKNSEARHSDSCALGLGTTLGSA